MDRAGRPWAAATGLFLLAVAVRALPVATILEGEQVQLFGRDAYYHMRRILFGVVRFPEILSFDPYINYPDGAKPIWPPLFDATLALLGWPFHAAWGEAGLEAAAVWVPPILGGATVVATHRLGLRFFGPRAAWLGALSLALLSGHFWYSQVGFVDHHAAVALVSTLLLFAAMKLTESLAAQGEGRLPRAEIASTAAAVAAAFLLWPGCLLHVGLVGTGLFALWITRPTRAAAMRTARALVTMHMLVLALLLPFTATAEWPQWSEFSPVVLSRFHPWLFGALALQAGLCWGAWHRGAGRTPARRGLLVLGSGGLVLAASFAILPGFGDGVLDAWRWFAKEEAFQAAVGESQPLLQVRGRFSVDVAELRLGRFFHLLPLALALLAWHVRSRPDRAAIWLLVMWTAGLAAATLVQRRFFNDLSAALCLVLGWTVSAVHAAVARRTGTGCGRLAAPAVAAILLLLLLAPTFEAYRRPVINLWRAARDRPLFASGAERDLWHVLEVATWLRTHTPPTAGYLDPSRTPEWGVLAPLNAGHVIEYVARRPAVMDNFGDDVGEPNFLAGRRYFATPDPAEAEAIATRLRVRYVVAPPASRTRPAPEEPLPMRHRLALRDGRGLGGLRLVFESSHHGLRPDSAPYKVFERVAGARVHGRAAPGSEVRAHLELRTVRGRLVSYRIDTATDAAGAYVLRLPHANSGGPPSLRPEPAYRVESEGCSARFRLKEGDVSRVLRVHGPDV